MGVNSSYVGRCLKKCCDKHIGVVLNFNPNWQAYPGILKSLLLTQNSVVCLSVRIKVVGVCRRGDDNPEGKICLTYFKTSIGWVLNYEPPPLF